ncbi:hypothetical protein VTO73DRAFT_10889 [Trametes versicolor]
MVDWIVRPPRPFAAPRSLVQVRRPAPPLARPRSGRPSPAPRSRSPGRSPSRPAWPRLLSPGPGTEVDSESHLDGRSPRL